MMAVNTMGELVTLKDDVWFKRQKYAGHCVATILNSCEKLIKDKTPNLSLKDLEQVALQHMKELDCKPTFFGYRGFPSAICTSVNKQLVHGIVTDYVLQDKDVISVDLGATYEGAIADGARTFVYGEAPSKEVSKMIDTCYKALQVGIDAVKIGNRVGSIGDAINKYVKDSGFGLITKYGGHGISYNTPHDSPFIANKSSKNDGIRIQSGLAIAIEPMLTIGSNTKTVVLGDKWTVVGENLNCHFEHSIFVESSGNVHIITDLQEG